MARLKEFDAFVSYSRRDQALVRPLVQLMGLTDRKVFWDEDSIAPGERWESRIEGALALSKVVVLLWCCHGGSSEWVAKETRVGIKRQNLVPVLLCGFPVPKAVQEYQWVDLSGSLKHQCSSHDEMPPQGETASPSPANGITVQNLLRREMGIESLQTSKVARAWDRYMIEHGGESTPAMVDYEEVRSPFPLLPIVAVGLGLPTAVGLIASSFSGSRGVGLSVAIASMVALILGRTLRNLHRARTESSRLESEMENEHPVKVAALCLESLIRASAHGNGQE